MARMKNNDSRLEPAGSGTIAPVVATCLAMLPVSRASSRSVGPYVLESSTIEATGMDCSKLTGLLVETVKAMNAKMLSQSGARDTEIKRLKEQNAMLTERLCASESFVSTLATNSLEGRNYNQLLEAGK